ncbi:hypothetical protein C5167_026496 [Papaver somniferum]|uniref:uncharacterized protein LOC113326751 n=1 Tax=Papaver somniferum TaxID=3469 RepID=UPI000E70555E|nr:uncharacterized protein LOC113326751 [Papaver somniferum]RZC85826.1 hypothetical protein C5167_026496 [Papaver somniferum]
MAKTNFMRGVVSTTALVSVFIMMSAALLPHVMGIRLMGPGGCYVDIPDVKPVVLGSDFNRDFRVVPGDNGNLNVGLNDDVDPAAVNVNQPKNPGEVSVSVGNCGR